MDTINPKDTRETKDIKGRLESALKGSSLGVLCILGVLCAARQDVRAQFQMPDPKEMAGIPRPVEDLPNGAISVRLIRGQLSNNIVNHPVELHVGSKVITVKTDDAGRAQFNEVTPGVPVKASADVDGEHLESREFPSPTRGGIRVMLVATDTSKPPAPSTNPQAVTGSLTMGSQSRIVMQPGEDTVEVFYLLDIANNAAVAVNPPSPFVFDLPRGAPTGTMMQGSSKQASINGTRVTVQAPFAPGHTFVEVAFELPGGSGTIDIAQQFPAPLDQLAVVVKKVGGTTLSSIFVKEQREVPADGEVFIAATGGAVPAGQPVVLSLSGFPHHSPMPRIIALTLAAGIAIVGVFAAARPMEPSSAATAERKRLIARRDKLFNDLVRLEHDRRNGRVDDRRYTGRREDLLLSLEHVYSTIDSRDIGPGPEDRSLLAAPVGALEAP
jgi:hypothetical protein